MLKSLSEYQVALIVVEATGGLQRECAAFLASAGYEVTVANPRQVRRRSFDLHKANGSLIAKEALTRIAALYGIEKQIRKKQLRSH